VTLENQIRGLAVVFGIRLPRALTAAFVDNALKASEGIAGLSVAMRGLIAARTAVMTAVAAIDADMRRMTRASAACRGLMTIPGVGQRRLASVWTGSVERHWTSLIGIRWELRGARAGSIPAPPAITEGLPALVGDRDCVLQLDEAATGMRDRRLDRDDHAGLKR
jgi:hypothetical protein